MSDDDGFVDRIYEASLVADLWPKVLDDIMRIASATGAVLIAARGENFRWIASSPAFEEMVRGAYQMPSGAERTRRLLAADRAGFITDHDVYTAEEIAEEPIFRDLLVPHGYGSGVGTAICASSGDALIFHAERPQIDGPVSPRIVAELDQARPHLARAALVSARLALQNAKATAQALEMLGLAGAVLRDSGRILAGNDLLAELMPSIVQDRSARLTLADAAADSLFAAALRQLSSDFDTVAVRSIPIRGSKTHGPLIVHVLPIRGVANDLFSSAACIVVLTPVTAQEAPPAAVVQGLFDLTPAEAKLAALIASGLPPRGAAGRLGITEETARTVLKRVFYKVGVSRQSELAALLAGLTLR